MRNCQKGFTFVELIIIIAIIGILAAIATPRFVDLSKAAKISATKGSLGAVRSVLAIRYAQSATAGGTPTYPASIGATDFADGQDPTNALSTKKAVTTTASVPNGTDTNATVGFWYISSGASAGRAGAFSDGTEDTSTY